jgi:hypothetical protein
MRQPYTARTLRRLVVDMSKLRTSSNFSNPDNFYALLREAHEGLSVDDSMALNIKLLLLLANHIGDLDVVEEAIAAARATA